MGANQAITVNPGRLDTRLPGNRQGPRLAFVQDALPFYGGAERLLAQALRAFPGTPVYTLVHNPQRLRGTALQGAEIHTSFINRLPGAHRNHRIYLPLYPRAVESFDLSAYNLIISFSYAAAHGVITHPGQTHAAVFYTPLRRAYHPGQAPDRTLGPAGWAFQRLLDRFRDWDRVASSRPDLLLAISAWVADLVQRAYRRPAQILYPPVEVERFYTAPERGNYYICVARLEQHKRLDLLIQAFNRLGLPLILVGEGSQRNRLMKMAGSNIHFLGSQKDIEVARLLSQARAFVHAAAEDFGIALVEAQAAGCPVIAFQAGGAGETVIHERTGILFSHQNAQCLIETVLSFEADPHRFSPADLRASAERFSAQRFRTELANLVQTIWSQRYGLEGDYEHIPLPAQPAEYPTG